VARRLHPATEDITLEGILHALADPVRMRIFAKIAKEDGARMCSAYLEVCNRQTEVTLSPTSRCGEAVG
jgi:hypothetical protein